MKRTAFFILICLLSNFLPAQKGDDIEALMGLLSPQAEDHSVSMKHLNMNWDPSLVPMLAEVIFLLPDPDLRNTLTSLIKQYAKPPMEVKINTLYSWLSTQEFKEHKDYRHFKHRLYGFFAGDLADIFSDTQTTEGPLWNIRWQGVRPGRLATLDFAKLGIAEKAKFSPRQAILGIQLGKAHLAYPISILTQPIIFQDFRKKYGLIGTNSSFSQSITIFKVPDSLQQDGFIYAGLLRNGFPLIYHNQFKTLWDGLTGKAIAWPKGTTPANLVPQETVITNWASWKGLYPNSELVLPNKKPESSASISQTQLDQFSAPYLGDLTEWTKSDDLVLGVELADKTGGRIAISKNFLNRTSIYHAQLGDQLFVIITDKGNGSRVYEMSEERIFLKWDKVSKLIDKGGLPWRMTEESLVGPNNAKYPRVRSVECLWGNWIQRYPDSFLVE